MRRRRFLQHASVAATIPAAGLHTTAVLAQQVPTRPPLDKYLAVPGNTDKLVRLFATMREMKASEPSSFFFQAAIHEVPNFAAIPPAFAGYYKPIKDIFDKDPKAAEVLMTQSWNQCTHDRMNRSGNLEDSLV